VSYGIIISCSLRIANYSNKYAHPLAEEAWSSTHLRILWHLSYLAEVHWWCWSVCRQKQHETHLSGVGMISRGGCSSMYMCRGPAACARCNVDAAVVKSLTGIVTCIAANNR